MPIRRPWRVHHPCGNSTFGAGFLTLDEPTNHLDLDTIEWLEALLAGAPFGFILVTHDRYFLDEVCTAIMEIDDRRLYKYEGNYSVYLQKKAERAEILERAQARRTSILRGELEWLKRGPRARTGKDKSRKERISDLRDAGVRKDLAMAEFSSTHRRLGKNSTRQVQRPTRRTNPTWRGR